MTRAADASESAETFFVERVSDRWALILTKADRMRSSFAGTCAAIASPTGTSRSRAFTVVGRTVLMATAISRCTSTNR